MAERKSGKFIVPSQGGAMRGFVQRLKLSGSLRRGIYAVASCNSDYE